MPKKNQEVVPSDSNAAPLNLSNAAPQANAAFLKAQHALYTVPTRRSLG
jgi:hypothetical protein